MPNKLFLHQRDKITSNKLLKESDPELTQKHYSMKAL